MEQRRIVRGRKIQDKVEEKKRKKIKKKFQMNWKSKMN